MAHARVPKFGYWEAAGNVPYTQYFDDARKGKITGKMINPNDPRENPESFDDHHAKPKVVDPGRWKNRTSVGSDRRFERSPLHPSHHARYEGRNGVNSPSWEKRGSLEAPRLSPSTQGQPRASPGGRGDGMQEKGAAVPKFGAWDESNPSSADGFTHIFEKVREGKQVGPARAPAAPNNSSYPSRTRKPANGEEPPPSGCGCFGWLKN